MVVSKLWAAQLGLSGAAAPGGAGAGAAFPFGTAPFALTAAKTNAPQIKTLNSPPITFLRVAGPG